MGSDAWRQAKELRDFQDLDDGEKFTELWLVTRDTRDTVQALATLVTGTSLNAWLMRIRNALTWLTPIAALLLTAWVAFLK